MRGFSTSRFNEIDDCLLLLRIEMSNKDTECCTRLGVGTAGALACFDDYSWRFKGPDGRGPRE